MTENSIKNLTVIEKIVKSGAGIIKGEKGLMPDAPEALVPHAPWMAWRAAFLSLKNPLYPCFA